MKALLATKVVAVWVVVISSVFCILQTTPALAAIPEGMTYGYRGTTLPYVGKFDDAKRGFQNWKNNLDPFMQIMASVGLVILALFAFVAVIIFVFVMVMLLSRK